MKPRKIFEEQIIGILKQAEYDVKVDDLCRRHFTAAGFSYAWRKKFGIMEFGEAARLRELEEDTRKLESLVVTLSLDNQMLKAVKRKIGKAYVSTRVVQTIGEI